MKHISQGVKVGILAILMVVGAYGVWKTVGQRASSGGTTELAAQFRDASGLPEGSRVVIAGLPVGEIDELTIQGRYARVRMRLRDDLQIYANAVAMKKSSSLLGDYYVEIDPGSPFSIDPQGNKVENPLLDSGAEITRVIEATSPDQLLRRVEQSMPKVDQVLLSVRDLSEDLRALINGPINSMTNRLDRLVQDEAQTVERVLARLDSSLARVEQITKDIRAVTQGADARVNKILDQIDDASAEAKTLVSSARTEVEQTGTKLRDKLDLVDEFLDRSTSIATKIDDDKGTLGRLVNDSTIADDIEEITGSDFVKTLFKMQTWVGLRSEYHWWPSSSSGGDLFAGNHYVTVELRTRPDKFYLIEFNRGFRGAFPDTELVVDPVPNDNGTDQYRRRVTIRDGTRITFQFGKRIGWATFRFGIKESTGGIGFDGQWFDDQLKLSVDVFDTTFNAVPRLKLSAAYSFFKHIYLVAGLDDVLNEHKVIETAELQGGIPIAFESFHYGRDAFFGAYLQFNDLDLTALLTIGSGIIMAAAE